MRRWLTIALGGLALSCQGPAAVMAVALAAAMAVEDSGDLVGIGAKAST